MKQSISLSLVEIFNFVSVKSLRILRKFSFAIAILLLISSVTLPSDVIMLPR